MIHIKQWGCIKTENNTVSNIPLDIVHLREYLWMTSSSYLPSFELWKQFPQLQGAAFSSFSSILQVGGCREPNESQKIPGNQQPFFLSQCLFTALTDDAIQLDKCSLLWVPSINRGRRKKSHIFRTVGFFLWVLE